MKWSQEDEKCLVEDQTLPLMVKWCCQDKPKLCQFGQFGLVGSNISQHGKFIGCGWETCDEQGQMQVELPEGQFQEQIFRSPTEEMPQNQDRKKSIFSRKCGTGRHRDLGGEGEGITSPISLLTTSLPSIRMVTSSLALSQADDQIIFVKINYNNSTSKWERTKSQPQKQGLSRDET